MTMCLIPLKTIPTVTNIYQVRTALQIKVKTALLLGLCFSMKLSSCLSTYISCPWQNSAHEQLLQEQAFKAYRELL